MSSGRIDLKTASFSWWSRTIAPFRWIVRLLFWRAPKPPSTSSRARPKTISGRRSGVVLTTDHAPKRFQVGDRQLPRPCEGMVVAVDVACMRAITAHNELAPKRGLGRALGIRPCGIAAEGAHRRPVRHRRRRSGFIILSKIAGGVDDLPADDGQIGCHV